MFGKSRRWVGRRWASTSAVGMQKWKVFNEACGFLLFLCWRAERRSRRKQVKTGEQWKPQRPVLTLFHPHHTSLSTDSLCFSLPLLFSLARKFAVSMALFPDLSSSGVKPDLPDQDTPRHEPANSSQLLSRQDWNVRDYFWSDFQIKLFSFVVICLNWSCGSRVRWVWFFILMLTGTCQQLV